MYSISTLVFALLLSLPVKPNEALSSLPPGPWASFYDLTAIPVMTTADVREQARRLQEQTAAVEPPKDPIWEKGGVMKGYFSHYKKNPTDATLAYNVERGLLPPDLPPGTVYIAHPNCGMLGWKVWVNLGRGWEEAYIFDCAGHAETLAIWANEDVMAELDYYTAKEVGAFGNGWYPGSMSYDPRS